MAESDVRPAYGIWQVVLSFSDGVMSAALRDEPSGRFDETFVAWLEGRSCEVIDMRDTFREMFSKFT